MHSVPVAINVRCFPNSDIIFRRSEVRQWAISRLMRYNMAAHAVLYAFLFPSTKRKTASRDGLSKTCSAGAFAGSRKGDQAARLNASCTA